MTTIPISFRVSPEKKESIEKAAQVRGLSMTQYIVSCVDVQLEKKSIPEPDAAVVEKIQFLKQIACHGFDWTGNQILITKGIEELWNLVAKDLQ